MANSDRGDFWEWNDLDAVDVYAVRGLRGGSWGSYDVFGNDLASSSRVGLGSSSERGHFGFRVAMVPEPRSMLMGLALLASGLLGRHRGKTSL